MRYCLFYEDKNLTAYGINCRPSPGMVEGSREEYYALTGDSRAAGPEPQPVPTIDERVGTLEADKADKTEVQAVWDTMAAAYAEGVESVG